MEGENEPLLSRATSEPDAAIDKSRKGMSHSVNVYTVRRSVVKCVFVLHAILCIQDNYNRRMPPITQCISFPGGLADSDESRNAYQRIGGKVYVLSSHL